MSAHVEAPRTVPHPGHHADGCPACMLLSVHGCPAAAPRLAEFARERSVVAPRSVVGVARPRRVASPTPPEPRLSRREPVVRRGVLCRRRLPLTTERMKITTTALVVLANTSTLAAQTTVACRRAIPSCSRRAAAIAAALASNPQLEVAREQTAQARARRVEAVAIPDPTATLSLDNQPGFFQLGSAPAKNACSAWQVPFPDKFRLRNRIAIGGRALGGARLLPSCDRQLAAQTSRSLRLAARRQPASRRSCTTSRELARGLPEEDAGALTRAARRPSST